MEKEEEKKSDEVITRKRGEFEQNLYRGREPRRDDDEEDDKKDE